MNPHGALSTANSVVSKHGLFGADAPRTQIQVSDLRLSFLRYKWASKVAGHEHAGSSPSRTPLLRTCRHSRGSPTGCSPAPRLAAPSPARFARQPMTAVTHGDGCPSLRRSEGAERQQIRERARPASVRASQIPGLPNPRTPRKDLNKLPNRRGLQQPERPWWRGCSGTGISAERLLTSGPPTHRRTDDPLTGAKTAHRASDSDGDLFLRVAAFQVV